MKYFDRLSFFITVFCSFVFAAKFCTKQTGSFTISTISSHRPYHAEFDTRPLASEEEGELKRALGQKYICIGGGGQVFVFLSEDGNYVVKFLKQRLFRPSWLLNHLPLPSFLHKFRDKRNWKRADKLRRDFFSYKVAFDELKQETGILYVHLNPTHHLQTKLSIKDRLGIWHKLDLDPVDFIVQRRAERVYDRVEKLIAEGKIEEAKETIAKIFAMITFLQKKGLRDRDPCIETNCGFIGDEAIKIDVGRFTPCEAMKNSEERSKRLLQITAPFEHWIEKNHSILLPSYREIKEAYLQ